MKNLFLPFKELSSQERLLSTILVIALVFTTWSLSGNKYIPTPFEIAGSLPRLINDKNIAGNFIKSLAFCFQAMGYSLLIAVIVSYLSVLPLFTTFCTFLRKFRFLPSTGLSFLFMKMTDNIDQQMFWMMIFGVTTWMIDAMVGIALSINRDDVMYARSLRLSRWECMRELLIKGKAAQMFIAAISIFAVAWMLLASIENIAKASGGIGVILAESNKYYKFEEVYAIQLLIFLTGIGMDTILNIIRKWLFPYSNVTK